MDVYANWNDENENLHLAMPNWQHFCISCITAIYVIYISWFTEGTLLYSPWLLFASLLLFMGFAMRIWVGATVKVLVFATVDSVSGGTFEGAC